MNSRSARAVTRLALWCLLGFLAREASGAATLRERISAAAAGDTLVVDGGVHVGDLVLDRTVHLRGQDLPVIRGSGRGSVITILAPGCTIDGFVVEHTGAMLVNEDAGILVKADHVVLSRNVLRDILFGIYLYHADSCTVEGNTITGRAEIEQGGRGSGIHLWNANGNRLEGNIISEARDGFYLQNANHTLIAGNEVHHLRYGLHYMYADSNVFLRNVFRDNVAGAAIMFTRHIVMKHNVFLRNRGYASYGLLLQDCHDSEADSNIVSDNAIGIFFECSTNNRFRDNVIARNDLALHMFQNSVRNSFAGNAFIDNLNPLTIVGKRTESFWSIGGEGNYWSTYDGYDLDGDGKGDVPMRIENVFSYLEGRNANIRLYLYSPASQALSVSAKAFPILDGGQERDNAPLMEPVRLTYREGAAAGESGPHPVVLLWVAAVAFPTIVIGTLQHRRRR